MSAAAIQFNGLEVAIVENEPPSMRGLMFVLEQMGCDVIWTARNEQEALNYCAEKLPRVAFVDLRLEQGNDNYDAGWDLIKQMCQIGADQSFKVVIYSSTPVTYDIVLEAIRLGCSYIVKEDLWDHEMELVAGALLVAQSGGIILSNEVASSVETVARRQDNNELLSEREWEVLRFMAEGLSNKEIAKKQFVAISTIKSQVSSILTKLNVRNRVEAAEWYRLHI